MSETYNVIGTSKSLYESMTKEEILAAIVQAVEGGSILDVDTGFVTTIKEINANVGISLWVGTTAQFNALTTKSDNVLYIKTDDDSFTNLQNAVTALQTLTSGLSTTVSAITSDTGWQTLSIDTSTGFTAGSVTPKYRKIGNHVYVRGTVSCDMDTIADFTATFATLPSGCAPATGIYWLVPGEADRMARLRVNTTGAINLNYFKSYAGVDVTGSHWVQLNCDFLTD